MPMFKANINALEKAGIREKVIVMVGGAPVTQEYADAVGADGYSPDASSAVKKAKELIRGGGVRRDPRHPACRPGQTMGALAHASSTRSRAPIWGCQMCGQCVLHSTGLTCPMNCPKTLRNGPCGGVRPDGHCEVKPEMRCVWLKGYERSRRLPTVAGSLQRAAPARRQPAQGHIVLARTCSAAEIAKRRPAGSASRPRRCPCLSASSPRASSSSPPRCPLSTAAVIRRSSASSRRCRHYLDAVNATDNPSAHAHASPSRWPIALRQCGIEPMMQLTCRDRNRLALQADIVGAAMHGVENLCCLTGDDVTAGDEPRRAACSTSTARS